MLSLGLVIKKLFQGSPFYGRTFLTSSFQDIKIPRLSVSEIFFRYADVYPNNIALIDDVRKISYTYSETKRCINNISSALNKKGLKVGTMVGIIAFNSPEYIMLIYAISSMGCSVTICNQNYTKTELAYQLSDSKPSILFTDINLINKVTEVSSQIPSIKDIYLMGNRSNGYKSVEDLLQDNGDMSSIGQVNIDIDNAAALMPYSSGTTGLPKGVMLTHKNLVSNTLQISTAHPVTANNVMVMNLPLYHIYATMIITTMAFTSGSTIVIQPKFDSIQFLKAIEKYKVTVLHLVPPQILFFLNHPEVPKYDLSSVNKCFSAAAPLNALVERRFLDKFRIHQPKFNIFQAYGLSETSPITHIVPDNDLSLKKHGSVGLLVPNMKCKVLDVTTRKEVGANVDGELLFQGPNVMKKYFGETATTMKAFEDHWFLSGDIGHYDKDQYFYIVDRLKELIKVKGMQVAPAEIEGILLSHPAIADCAVIGIPHDKQGEVPKAFIVKAKEISKSDIHEHVSEHLSPYKHLKGGIEFIDEIPKSASGKILRRLLKIN